MDGEWGEVGSKGRMWIEGGDIENERERGGKSRCGGKVYMIHVYFC